MFVQQSQNLEAFGSTTYLKVPLGYNLENVSPHPLLPTLGINDGCFAVDTETKIPYYVGNNYWREILFTKFHVSHAWLNDGNRLTDPTKNFIGTIDNVDFIISAGNGILTEHGTTRFTTNGQIEQIGTGNCVFLGEKAGINTIIGVGTDNTFLGFASGESNTIGDHNTSTGKGALNRNIAGNENVAYGYCSQEQTIVSQNSSFGALSMQNNVDGIFNTSLGYASMQYGVHTTGNTAIGYNSYRGDGINTPTGNYNTCTGFEVLLNNRTGANNTVSGALSMFSNISGDNNASYGYQSMFSNISGDNNTSIGYQSLYHNTNAIENVSIGARASYLNTDGIRNTIIGSFGFDENTTGDYNIGMGYGCLPNNTIGNNNIGLGVFSGENYLGTENNCAFLASTGSSSQVGLDGQIEIGTLGVHQQTFIQGVFNNTPPIGSLCPEVNAYGKFGVPATCLANMEDISAMDNASDNLYDMTPVQFVYKNTPSEVNYGLLAEDVLNHIPSLVVYDINSDIYGVKYQQLTSMILNETIKLNTRETIIETLVALLENIVAIHDAFLRLITGGVV